jgi:hypothetical protein
VIFFSTHPFIMMMMSPKSQQSNRVQQELEALRQKHLAKSQRQKLKDCECVIDSFVLVRSVQ